MKSAYELAMERLEKQSPTQKLSERQKSEISEIDSVTRSKIAEREVFLQGQIDKARNSGDEAEALELEQQLARDVKRLHDDAEEKREKVRQKKS
jgi:translation initiation factor 2 beta subunit (eIF-2beta)/eIF-5